MSKYWKADVLRKLIKIEKENNEDATITMKYLTYLEEKLKLIEQAYGFTKGRKELAEEILKTIKNRENNQPIGTVTRIYSYCRKQIRLADELEYGDKK